MIGIKICIFIEKQVLKYAKIIKIASENMHFFLTDDINDIILAIHQLP